MTHRIFFLAGVVLAGVFGWLTLRHIDAAALRSALRDIAPVWIALGLGFLILGYGCRIQRWRSMLRPHNPALGFLRCGVAFVGSIAVNNVLPFRTGDVLRCFGFSRWLSVPSGPIMASVLAERLLDLVALILALALALWAFSLGSVAMQAMRLGGLVLGAVGTIAMAVLLAPKLLAPVLWGLTAVAGLTGAKVQAKIATALDALMETLIQISRRRAMGSLLCWTVLVWAFEAATYWAIARALPALSAPEAAWLAMPMGTLSTLLPSTPGHVGTFDYFAQWATMAAGNPLSAATAFVLVTHVALWGTTTLIGGLCLIIWTQMGGRPGPGKALR